MAVDGEPRPGSLARQPWQRPGGVGSATGTDRVDTPAGVVQRPAVRRHRSAARLDVAPGSVDPRSVQLVDGETGQRLPRDVAVSGNTLTRDPGLAGSDRPAPTRWCSTVFAPPAAGRWPTSRVGFRTLS